MVENQSGVDLTLAAHTIRVFRSHMCACDDFFLHLLYLMENITSFVVLIGRLELPSSPSVEQPV